MSDRRYLPEAYFDEICPEGRSHPSDWIGAPLGDVWSLHPADDLGEEDPIRVSAGEVVEFHWYRDLGDVELTYGADGQHTIVGTVDPDASVFSEPGNESIGDSIEDFAQQNLDEDPDLVGQTVTVQMTKWSEAAEPWRLEAAPTGPRFVSPAGDA